MLKSVVLHDIPIDHVAAMERWYYRDHAPEIMRQPGLFRFFSHRAIREPLSLPGEWPRSGRPAPESILHAWDRLVELCCSRARTSSARSCSNARPTNSGATRAATCSL
ncbi:hypothetical protein [Castellaniella defragrans]|uniref:EthD domain-containing protein n=1 Tax=Castellaniella defragrans TaxID=75697 RepID=A0A7W9TNM5_CASDE|nr:hypothetical protein [Castellaniella defragrans]KAB0622572.1 hypothetical protein F7Q88_03010 [Castellaniella defragrans]MBB6082977.1 hypothetical protein [Castellaniella defragrans]